MINEIFEQCMAEGVMDDIVDRIIDDLNGEKEVSDESVCFAIADHDNDIKDSIEALLAKRGIKVIE